MFTSTCAFFAIYLNITVSISQKLVLFQPSHCRTQTSRMSVYASADIYKSMPFEINCTLNLKAILGSLVCYRIPFLIFSKPEIFLTYEVWMSTN